MNKKKFIPELHDIGKLVDKKNIKNACNVNNNYSSLWKGHVFIDFDFNLLGISHPTSPSWWGQYHHFKDTGSIINLDINQWPIGNGNDIPSIEDKYNLFLLILADHLASSVSRAISKVQKSQPQKDGILKLWNENYYENQKKKGKYWAAFKSLKELTKMFDEIQNCQSGEEFLKKYKEYLLLTPEDKSFPLNVTSLYTHCELVGKIYRVLEKNTKIVNTNCNGRMAIEYENQKVCKVIDAEGEKKSNGRKGKWQAKLIKCWIKIPHSFVRLQDINLLKKRDELINHTIKQYKYETLLTTSDFIFLFLPAKEDVKQIFEPFLKWNFYIECEEILADLGILNSILDKKILKSRKANVQLYNNRNVKVRKTYILPDFPEKIEPPICEICQQRRGVNRKKGIINEWICDKCSEIRSMGNPFKEYGTTWEKDGIKVCWFKFSLDQRKLENWLCDKYQEYIKNNTFRDEFRPIALQIDFNNDYKEMLEKFWNEIDSEKYEEFKENIKKPIQEYNELGVFKYSPQLVKKIIEEYINLFEVYFKDCISNERCPISLSLSVSNIKYPIREHWKYLESNKKSFLNIRYHQVFMDHYTKNELKNIIGKVINKKASNSFLYKLIEIEKDFNSIIHLYTEIFNNKKKYPDVYDLVLNDIKPTKFLNFYKLVGREKNEVN